MLLQFCTIFCANFFVRSVSSTIFGNGNGFAELTPDSVPTKKNIHLFFHYIELRPHCHHIVVMLCHSWCAPFSVSTEFFRAGFWSIQQASFGTGPSLSSTLFILSIIA